MNFFSQVEMKWRDKFNMKNSRFSHPHLSCKVSSSLPGGGRHQVHMKVHQLKSGTIVECMWSWQTDHQVPGMYQAPGTCGDQPAEFRTNYSAYDILIAILLLLRIWDSMYLLFDNLPGHFWADSVLCHLQSMFVDMRHFLCNWIKI